MKGNAIARRSNPDVILVATNLLEGQTYLLHAIYQARLSRAIILLVHVITRSGLRSDASEVAPSLALDPAIHAARMKLDEFAEEFQFEGVVCETIVMTGDPAEQISLVAKSRAVDRLILAARYESGPTRMVEASVAEKVIATVDIPVCFIGRLIHPSPACDAPLGGVLCATSLHSNSSQAVCFASALAELNHAHLTLLHVLDTEGMSEQGRQLARFAARQRLCASLPTEARHRDHPNFLIREGDPALIILAEALSRSQDFVILGSHHNQMASRPLMNGVVRRVIHESHCPVITINTDSASSPRGIHELTSSEAMSIHS
jgi:nucleotide-binding universal stress UspA family protein